MLAPNPMPAAGFQRCPVPPENRAWFCCHLSHGEASWAYASATTAHMISQTSSTRCFKHLIPAAGTDLEAVAGKMKMKNVDFSKSLLATSSCCKAACLLYTC